MSVRAKNSSVKTSRTRQDSQSGRVNKTQSASEPAKEPWTFLTNHAHVLILLYSEPELVLREVALRVGITERAVQRIVQELEEAGYLKRERIGRRNRYQILGGKRLRHPVESHCTIDQVLDLVCNTPQPRKQRTK